MTPKPLTGAILETVLYADDLESARTFYEQVIGLELVSQEPGRHLFFRIGQSMLLVFNPEATADSRVEVRGNLIPQHGAKGPGHVAFRVNRLEADRIESQLAQAGVPVETKIEWPGFNRPGDRGQSIYCRDPAGNSVEFAPSDLWFQDGTHDES